MDEKQLNFYMTSIGEMIFEENQIVTYKSLSASLGIHVNTAKQLLYAFLTQQKRKKNLCSITATYLLAGKLKNCSNAITIVDENNKGQEISKFLEITSDHIYSIQNANLNSINALCGISIHKTDSKKQVVIHCTKCVMKPKNKNVDSYNEIITKIDNAVEDNCENNIKSKPQKKENNVIDSNKMLFKNYKEGSLEKKSKDEKSQKTTGNIKSNNNIATLFVNAAHKSANKTNVSDSKSISPVQTNVFVDNTKNIDEKSNVMRLERNKFKNVAKKKKEKGIKRKRIQLLSSDSDDNSFESSTEDEHLFDKKSVPVPSLKTNHSDDFCKFEDNKREEERNPKNKIKKRKMIDITVMSEDGYLETRKEVTTVTDSEDENMSNPPANKLDQVLETNGQLKSESKINKVGLKKQSSLLSFFKKN